MVALNFKLSHRKAKLREWSGVISVTAKVLSSQTSLIQQLALTSGVYQSHLWISFKKPIVFPDPVSLKGHWV